MMKRLVILGLPLMASLLVYFFLFSGDTDTADDRSPSQKPHDSPATMAVLPVPVRDADAEADETPSASSSAIEQPDGASGLTDTEAEILTMYDEMAGAFAEQRGNCNRMAMAVEAVTQANGAALARWQQQRAEMGEEAFVDSLARVQRAQAARVESLRHQIEQGVARCKDFPRLLHALKALASVGVQQ